METVFDIGLFCFTKVISRTNYFAGKSGRASPAEILTYNMCIGMCPAKLKRGPTELTKLKKWVLSELIKL